MLIVLVELFCEIMKKWANTRLKGAVVCCLTLLWYQLNVASLNGKKPHKV